MSDSWRLAVLADIHGNIDALEAVLARLATLGCDQVLNLGDCFSGPLEAVATAEFLLSWPAMTVRGNHDRQLLELPPAAMGPSDQAAHSQLEARHLQWLAGLQASLTFELGGVSCHACHGTPQSDTQYLLETVEPQLVRAATAQELGARLAGIPARMIFTAHSHLPGVVVHADQLIVNPGSVGLPAYSDTQPYPHIMSTGSPHARFALVEFVAGKEPGISHHAVAYDTARMAKLARERGRPDWEEALLTGRISVAGPATDRPDHSARATGTSLPGPS